MSGTQTVLKAKGKAIRLSTCNDAGQTADAQPGLRFYTYIQWIEILHTGKCIRRFACIYAYCRYFIDRKG